MGAIVTIKARVQSRSESLSIEVVGVCQCPSSDILWQHKVLDLTPNILPALLFAHFRQLEIKFQHTMLGKLILSSPLRLLRKMALLPKKSLLFHSSRMLMDFLRHAIPRPKSKSGSTFLWIGSKTWMALHGMFSPTSLVPCVPSASPPAGAPVHFRRLHHFGRPRQMPAQWRTEQQPQSSSVRGHSGGSYHGGSSRRRCGGGGGTRCRASTARRARFPIQRFAC